MARIAFMRMDLQILRDTIGLPETAAILAVTHCRDPQEITLLVESPDFPETEVAGGEAIPMIYPTFRVDAIKLPRKLASWGLEE